MLVVAYKHPFEQVEEEEKNTTEVFKIFSLGMEF